MVANQWLLDLSVQIAFSMFLTKINSYGKKEIEIKIELGEPYIWIHFFWGGGRKKT